ncbi:hypothetical protein [Salinispora arenicola]|uniref:hypothetical protein n=1 Tax=Salinispora arenicola TaxID=168697 RepID=UPI0003717FD2|nr:hypothetical protein [Salinispora arenicola]
MPGVLYLGTSIRGRHRLVHPDPQINVPDILYICLEVGSKFILSAFQPLVYPIRQTIERVDVRLVQDPGGQQPQFSKVGVVQIDAEMIAEVLIYLALDRFAILVQSG